MAGGLTEAGIGRLREVAEQHVGPTRVPGLVPLVASGAEVHVEALGSLTSDTRVLRGPGLDVVTAADGVA